jgi:hypothetical protein
MVFRKYIEVDEAGYPDIALEDDGDEYICRYGSIVDTKHPASLNLAALMLSGLTAGLEGQARERRRSCYVYPVVPIEETGEMANDDDETDRQSKSAVIATKAKKRRSRPATRRKVPKVTAGVKAVRPMRQLISAPGQGMREEDERRDEGDLAPRGYGLRPKSVLKEPGYRKWGV